jgi:hypothetical protein
LKDCVVNCVVKSKFLPNLCNERKNCCVVKRKKELFTQLRKVVNTTNQVLKRFLVTRIKKDQKLTILVF